MERPLVLLLEDEDDRIARFQSVLAKIAGDAHLIVWKIASEMISEVAPLLARARLISLDHDLYPPDESEDWGDGVEVAKFIAGHVPCCPVIVHSSNIPRAQWMLGDFELGGWDVRRVAPIGDDWIEVDWRLMVAKLLGNRA